MADDFYFANLNEPVTEKENVLYLSRHFWQSKNSIDMKHEQEKYRSLITWERPRKTEELTKQQESTP